VEGEEVGAVFQEETYIERYTAIVCDKCNTRAEILPYHVVDLLADNVKLQMMAAESRGITVVNTPQSLSKVMWTLPRGREDLKRKAETGGCFQDDIGEKGISRQQSPILGGPGHMFRGYVEPVPFAGFLDGKVFRSTTAGRTVIF
jgi:hypothetical protein